jgi:hypothetical protein
MTNRLAGSTFAYNVRFDQNRAQKIKDSIGIKDECLDIKPLEILVSHNSTSYSKHGKRTNVFSSAALFYDETDDENRGHDHRIEPKNIRFMGVAATVHQYSANDFRVDQGLVANVAGIVTVQNNSEQTMYPGDLLVLDTKHALSQEKGVPRDKKVFSFVKLEKVASKQREERAAVFIDRIIAAGVEAATARAAGVVSTILDAKIVIGGAMQRLNADEAEELRKIFLKELDDYEKKRPQVVAKALEYSKKRTKMDILLHPCQE